VDVNKITCLNTGPQANDIALAALVAAAAGAETVEELLDVATVALQVATA
jgi:hypothetical protein